MSTDPRAFIERLEPWADDVPLNGDCRPANTGQIEWLIEYLLTIHKRFGNTAVHVDGLSWGASALWARSDAARAHTDSLLAKGVENG